MHFPANRTATVDGFRRTFGHPPTLVARAPGRVNLIGEHTDYNDGLVCPAAIEFATWTALSPRSDRLLVVHAGNRDERLVIDLDDPGSPLQQHWSDYVRGTAVELERSGRRLAGAHLWFAGNVPAGAGLSSSAALEMSVGFALLSAAGFPPAPTDLALAGQRAEHHFAGTKCGIMDQFISAHARPGHALLLDCRSLGHRHLPLPESLSMVICDSGVKHRLADGEYNVRRAQCESGVAHLREHLPGIRALRDVSTHQLVRFGGDLPPVTFRRCRHVIGEIARVDAFAEALASPNSEDLGTLMAESHDSLRHDYDVSCPELDQLVELARSAPGIVGARMTGGGFGGCTVNLVDTAQVEAFRAQVSAGYRRTVGREPRTFVSRAASGASLEL